MIEKARTYTNEIYRIIEESVAKAEIHFGVTISRPTLSFELKSNRIAGQYWPRYELVKINPYFLAEHSDYILNQTVPHEVAHHITREIYGNVKSHGPEWKRVMRIIGLAPKRCHPLTLENKPRKPRTRKRYIYLCPSCEKQYKLSSVAHNRMEKGSHRYWCPRCKEDLSYTGNMHHA